MSVRRRHTEGQVVAAVFRLDGGWLFLVSPRKSHQKEGDPGSAVGCADFPALLVKPGTPRVLLHDAAHRSGRGPQLAPAGLKQCSPTSPGWPALLGAPQGEQRLCSTS